jgi:hypothetical protein
MGLVISKGLTLRKGFQWNETVWNPSMISTALWLDATDSSTITEDGGVVSQWNDKSGNARNAAQSISDSRPTYTSDVLNGLPALTLDGTDDYMIVPHNNALNIQIASSTVIAVYKKSAGFRLMQKKIGTGANLDAWFYDDAGHLSVASAFTTSYASNQNTWLIDSGTWDGSTLKHYRNGVKLTPTNVFVGAIVNGEIDPSFTPTVNTDDLQIGRRDNPSGTSGIMTGQIAAIILCNTALSDLDRQKVEGYYAHRLALTANLPNDHPYRTVGPTP